ncbi:hypothetical protein Hypma_004765 [Hypsizygus marmoreus]|uniref:Telomere-associated protein Rif1 N-terminal domain-containing protein n=1 Tax=Hypsizygus marmoreus TaxID=39966 RepID=A0A369J6Y2_HYPMA|nr:hypothetical protein Hypma_004765 [Hypsizygus marmoreus]
MSLLTPPSTSHRGKDKENRDLDPSTRVVFSEFNKIHTLGASPKFPTTATASRLPPGKSILKKCSALLVPFPQEVEREITPEPSDPLVNLTYLTYPVSTIIGSNDATELRHLIEAYSILTARLRASVTGATDIDASWPLFQPLRKNREALVEAVVRDLGRALVDPHSVAKEEEPPLRILLPSPKNTPKKKKKDGMTAEQVKYARDLCTTSHAVIRLLSLALTLPAVRNIFTDAQLREILTAVLAIPLADELPTPNARKTCALAIWLIQTQRLPSEVLTPAADRIALALRRGIDGELGKEGKKGSASDGLKAIHDLSIYLPSLFIPKFTYSLLPSILSNLLAPTLTLRTQACHALGGFVLGATELPRSSIHTQISQMISAFVTTPAPPKPMSPTKSLSSPLKSASQESQIVRTLRTTLQATEPSHTAHGPVWGLSVLSSFIVLLNSALMTDPKLSRTMSTLASLGMRHKRNTVRGLACIMWRCITWVYIQPPLPPAEDDDDEGEEEKESDDEQEKCEARMQKGRQSWWELVSSVTELETGVCTIVAQLSSPLVPTCRGNEDENEPLRHILEILNKMVTKDTDTCGSAVEVLKQLVGSSPSSYSASDSQQPGTLIPRALFSALPGLLTVDFTSLKSAVNPLYEETHKAEDVRALTREEMAQDGLWEGLVKAWRAILGSQAMWEGVPTKALWRDLVGIWDGLIGVPLGTLLDAADEDGVAEFALRAIDVLIDDILEDANLDLTPKYVSTPCKSRKVSFPVSSSNASPGTLKLQFTRDLWAATRTLVPHGLLENGGSKLLACLMKNAEEFTDFASSGYNAFSSRDSQSESERANEEWAAFCVDVLGVCGVEALKAFWGYANDEGERAWEWRWSPEERRAVWRVFVREWMGMAEAGWEGAVVLLGVPFMDGYSFDLKQEDQDQWCELLEHGIAKALDYGYDSFTVLSTLTHVVSTTNHASPTAAASCIRLVEFVMSHVAKEIADARELPESVLEFVNDVLREAYPPPPRLNQTFMWAGRAVSDVVAACPGEMVRALLEALAESMIVWIEDAERAWNVEDLEYDIITLYQNILVRIQELRLSADTLRTFATVIGAPFSGRMEMRAVAAEAFKDFWEATYAHLAEPAKGWPDEIKNCIQAVFGNGDSIEESKPEESCGSSTELDPSPLAAPFCASPASITQNSRTLVVSTRPSTPTTPTASTSSASLSTPPRPHKPSIYSFTQLPVHSPTSPMPSSISVSHALPIPALSISVSQPQTPRRTPRSPRHGSAKRRRLEDGDKENESPSSRVHIRSVAERIALRSPEHVWVDGMAKSVALGKRKVSDGQYGGDERPSPSKKGRKVVVYTVDVEEDSEDERIVEASLVEKCDSTDDAFAAASPTPHSCSSSKDLDLTLLPFPIPKKRKRGVFMESVEVPHFDQVYPRLRSCSSFDSALLGLRTPSSTRSTRQTRSASKAATAASSSTPWLLHTTTNINDSSRKRRRASAEDIFSSSPIRVLKYHDPKPQSKLVKSPGGSSELSSDDDPHIGQVTPHHLISPELLRSRGRYEDPPSDDSVMPASPSRDIVQRRLQRLGSLNGGAKVLAPLEMKSLIA